MVSTGRDAVSAAEPGLRISAISISGAAVARATATTSSATSSTRRRRLSRRHLRHFVSERPTVPEVARRAARPASCYLVVAARHRW